MYIKDYIIYEVFIGTFGMNNEQYTLIVEGVLFMLTQISVRELTEIKKGSYFLFFSLVNEEIKHEHLDVLDAAC